MSAPPAHRETGAADWDYIQAVDATRARQDHEDFLVLVEDEIRPAMRAFEVYLHLNHLACRIEDQGLRSPDAFRSTSCIALHLRLGSRSDDNSPPPPRLECVRSRRHPGEVLLVTFGLPGRGGYSGQMRRHAQVTEGLVFGLLEQLLKQVGDGAQQAPRAAGAMPSWLEEGA